MAEDIKDKLSEALEIISDVIEDTMVPRNIREALEKAKVIVSSNNIGVEGISSAMYLIDDISNDLNMPIHTRTDIWNILSILEEIKESIKNI